MARVTDKELKAFKAGKPVRAAVAEEYARRNGGSRKASRAISKADRRANAARMAEELSLLDIE